MEHATPGPLAESERRIRATGARVTDARVRVLAVLLSANRAIGHQEIEHILANFRVDRVTLYRVLEWLLSVRLAHRSIGGDRVWRFMAKHARHAPHAHFECNSCGLLSCLQESAVPPLRLPRGFRRQSVEITVRGWCGACAA